MHQNSSRPKLLFVIDNLSTGGAQRQLINLANGLTKRGYVVEVFCYAPGDMIAQPVYEAGIPIHWHIKRSRFSLDVILNLRRIMRLGHYDLALSFLNTPNFYLITANLSLGRNFPIVVSERSSDEPGWVTRAEQLVRYLYRFADHIIVNSNHQRLNLAAKSPAISNRYSTIYNGYDLNVFAPVQNEPNNDPLKLIVIASVSRYKNGLCLIEALKMLREKYDLCPQVDWVGQRVMYGDRLTYLQEMERQIQVYHLDKQWCWWDQRSDIVSQLHQHDVLVHPSYVEGLPNVVCEALACARPVIVSNTLDHPRLVQDGQSGYLFDWRDPNDLAQKIRIFSDLSLDERIQMGQKGRQFAEQNLSLDRYVDEYEHLFLGILNR